MGQKRNYCNLILVIDQDDNPELESQISNLAIPRFKTLVQKNAGQSSARNLGISEANANFVALLDHDDYWFQNHLEHLANVIRKSPDSAIYFTGVIYLDPDGNLNPAVSNAEIFEKGDVADLLSQDLMVWPTSMLLNKEALGISLRFNSVFKGYEDDDFLIRIVQSGKQVTPDIDPRTAVIRDHSSRHSYRDAMSQSALIFEAEYLELAKSLGTSNLFAQRFYDHHMKIYRNNPTAENKKKLQSNISTGGAVGMKPIVILMQLFSPEFLVKVLNRTIRLSRIFR